MKKNSFFKSPVFIILIAMAVILFMMSSSGLFSSSNQNETTYEAFLKHMENGEIDKAQITSETIIYTLKSDTNNNNNTNGTTGLWSLNRTPTYRTLRLADQYLVEKLHQYNVDFAAVQESNLMTYVYYFFSLGLPLILMIIMFIAIFRGMRKGDGIGGGFGFGKSNAKMFTLGDGSKKFDDVAGQDEAKEQLVELVDFLHQPQKYKAIGAKLPKGALLVGPPGTGKTLLAQAVAGEAGVPFFFVSGSAFVEMFVGAGAARVRDLFKQANEKAPCIIFIDEIDAIGKKRDTSGFSGNDEREQSLNQLLAEMDGFDPSKGIIVLGATNRPEILDQALLRPGRFDRRVVVELPDLNGREAVLKVHAKGVRMDTSVDLRSVAKNTPGASGADLANIINESALRAVRLGREKVTQQDLEAAIDTVVAGVERKSMVIQEEEKRIVSFHEIGHALAAARQNNTAPVAKITIIPHANGALGYTMQTDEEERFLHSKKDLLEKLVVFCAGRAAEELACGTCTTGAANDIERATDLAKAMITRYGMSDHFGMMTLESHTSEYLGNDGHLTCSADTAAQIDQEVKKLLSDAYEQAKTLLSNDMYKLNQLAMALLEKETMTGEEFMDILNNPPFAAEETAKTEENEAKEETISD